MDLASPPPRMPRCSAMSRSFLSGHRLRSGDYMAAIRSKDKNDHLIQGVHASRGTPVQPEGAGRGEVQVEAGCFSSQSQIPAVLWVA
jgi:hypothetical protein